jgi:hypothetical protein
MRKKHKNKHNFNKDQYNIVKTLGLLDTETLIKYKEDKKVELENCDLNTEEYKTIHQYIRLSNYVLKRRPSKIKKLRHKI